MIDVAPNFYIFTISFSKEVPIYLKNVFMYLLNGIKFRIRMHRYVLKTFDTFTYCLSASLKIKIHS